MEIVWHAHNAVISQRLKQRAEASVAKVSRRLNRTVGATIRFEREGTRCRVEVMLRAPRHRSLVAEGHGRYYGPALSVALDHLQRQVTSERRTAKDRAARAARA
ncbi:MAG: HPF/RaiA family ribosome-associated protein [Gemmatimonadaceae bacterium]